MSTLVYGAVTRKREEAEKGTSTSKSPPGLSSYVDALAALVPSEVLGLHAVILSFTTKTVKNLSGESVTTITEPGTLVWVFWALLGISVLLYVVSHTLKRWNKRDYVRVFIPPLGFVLWTMLQKTTAFDAVAPNLGQVPRDATALIGAVLLGLLAARLAYQADQSAPAD